MRSEEWMPMLDSIGRSMGYEAAARTETIVVTLVSVGADSEDIDIVVSPDGITVTVQAYDVQKHDQQRRFMTMDELSKVRAERHGPLRE